MKKLIILALIVCGCSSASSGSDVNYIDGLYSLKENVTSSTCSSIPTGTTYTDTMTVSDSMNQATETLADLGGDCPQGTVNGNAVVWSCVIESGSNMGASLDISAYFDNSGIAGSALITGPSCAVTLSFTGNRQ